MLARVVPAWSRPALCFCACFGGVVLAAAMSPVAVAGIPMLAMPMAAAAAAAAELDMMQDRGDFVLEAVLRRAHLCAIIALECDVEAVPLLGDEERFTVSRPFYGQRKEVVCACEQLAQLVACEEEGEESEEGGYGVAAEGGGEAHRGGVVVR